MPNGEGGYGENGLKQITSVLGGTRGTKGERHYSYARRAINLREADEPTEWLRLGKEKRRDAGDSVGVGEETSKAPRGTFHMPFSGNRGHLSEVSSRSVEAIQET